MDMGVSLCVSFLLDNGQALNQMDGFHNMIDLFLALHPILTKVNGKRIPVLKQFFYAP